jgi:hypothetical protein
MALGAKNGLGSSEFQNKAGVQMNKRLANLWSKKRITKKTYAGRGPETIWEILGEMHI